MGSNVQLWRRDDLGPSRSGFNVDPGAFATAAASFSENFFHQPTSGIKRASELFLSDREFDDPVEAASAVFVNVTTFGAVKLGTLSPKMEPAEANDRFGIEGLLEFDKPISVKRAAIIRDRKLEEFIRQETIRNGSTSGGRKVLSFSVGMAANIVDPISLGTMFLPIVSEARYAKMLKSMGGSVFKARAARGAMEAFAGNLMVEPLIVLPAMQDKTNYTFLDSALNLGVGTVLGAGLHVTGGFIGDLTKRMRGAHDMVSKLSSDDQHELFRVAISDFLDNHAGTSVGRIMELTDPIIQQDALASMRLGRMDKEASLGFSSEGPDTFNLYPDGFIPDPKLNEPWYSARLTTPENQGKIFNNTAGFTVFTRDPSSAGDLLSQGLRFDEGEMGVFVAQVVPDKIATAEDLVNASRSPTPDDFAGREFELLQDRAAREALKAQGFDAILLDIEGIDALVVLTPEKISVPGDSFKLTTSETGVLFDDASRIADSKDRTVAALRKEKTEALQAQAQQALSKEKLVREAAESQKPLEPSPHTFKDPDTEATLKTMQEDRIALEEEMGVTLTPEQEGFIAQAFEGIEDPALRQSTIESAIDCVTRSLL